MNDDRLMVAFLGVVLAGVFVALAWIAARVAGSVATDLLALALMIGVTTSVAMTIMLKVRNYKRGSASHGR